MKNDIEREHICYKLLLEVYSEGGYSNIVLGKGLNSVEEKDKPYITRLFYGVLENNIQFDYVISKLTEKKPKTSVLVIIKIGLYLLRYSNAPQYASIDKTVELCKKVGKSALSGFVNAVLRKSEHINTQDICQSDLRLSVNYNYPLWIVKKLINRYGYDFANDLLKNSKINLTHIRHNSLNIDRKDLETILPWAKKTLTGFYTDSRYTAIRPSLYVVQSLASTIAVNLCASLTSPKNVLDVCAAPGGKSVYLYELTKAKITSADVHSHRVELIKKYAEQVGARLNAVQNDATILKEDWMDKFDLVLCDVPCSGLGIIAKKPDIKYKDKKEIERLPEIQLSILKNSSRYLKSGGRLLYSTCTLNPDENERITDAFLKENPNFKRAGKPVTIFPDNGFEDGFFYDIIVKE